MLFFSAIDRLSQCYTFKLRSIASSFSNHLLVELIQTITSFTYKKRCSKLQGDSSSFARGGKKAQHKAASLTMREMSRNRNVKSLRVGGKKKKKNPTPVHLPALYFVMKLHSIVFPRGKAAPANQPVVFLKFKTNARMAMQHSGPRCQELHLTLYKHVVLNFATRNHEMPPYLNIEIAQHTSMFS